MISIAMLFCFLEQNFTEKGQSAAELAPKNDVYNGNRPPSWILFFFTFDHVSNKSAFAPQISSKSNDFLLRYDDFTIFNMADLRHVEL